jgi:Hsp20/alpha crystallin family
VRAHRDGRCGNIPVLASFSPAPAPSPSLVKTFKTSKEEYIKTERLYGEFYRAIPLPEGAIAEAATAVFVNGVLEIRLPVPPRSEPKTHRVNVEVKSVPEVPTTPLISQPAAV